MLAPTIGGWPSVAAAAIPPSGAWCYVPLWDPSIRGIEYCFSSPDATCVYGHQDMNYLHSGARIEMGNVPGGNWYSYLCLGKRWVIDHYVPQDAPVTFYCPVGYTRLPPGRCVLNNESFPPNDGPSCGPNAGGGPPTPSTGRPIDILSGGKRFDETDFEGATAGFALTRHFSSASFGGGVIPHSIPRNLANWRLGDSHEIHIRKDFTASPVGALILTPSGLSLHFDRKSDGSMAGLAAGIDGIAQTDYRLEFVGTWPGDLTTLTNTTTKWKLRDGQDNTYIIDTFQPPGDTKFTIGRVTSVTRANGETISYTYGTTGEMLSMADAYGNTITFDWFSALTMAPTPQVITQANLPGGYKVRYVYDYTTHGGNNVAATTLKRVEYVDPSNVVVDQTSYAYADTRFPTFVTDVKDKNGVVRWSVTYDDQARATSSSGPGGVEASNIAYSAPGAVFTRTVTNALGKQEVYTFIRAHVTFNDVRLAGTTGAASTNCPASATSLTYNSQKYVASTTDEEGRVTTFTRNARGQATQTVQASGTAAARTVNQTWHSTINAPTQVAEPGKTTSYAYEARTAGGEPPTYTVTQTFSHSATAQTYTVPASTTSATIELWGAAGGNGNYSAGAWSGSGGYLKATFAVSPGDVLKLEVGGGGRGATRGGDGGAGGWPDGGSGSKGDASGGGGGGSTRFYINSTLKGVAGGGGGSGGYAPGGSAGAGGGATAQSAASTGGTGGSQTAAGVDSNATTNVNKSGRSLVAYPGVQRTGGWGGSTGDTTTSTADDGGGGGGGYWGGGDGGGDGSSGGGGSSWVDPSATAVVSSTGVRQTPAQSPPGEPTVALGVNSGANGPAIAGGDGYAFIGLK